MNDLKICRQTSLVVSFYKLTDGEWIDDNCEFTVGLAGLVDKESGMIINLVEIDQGLSAFHKEFAQQRIDDIPAFFQSAREFLQNVFYRSSAKVETFSLKTSYGLVQWSSPWSDLDFLFVQKRKIKVSDPAGKSFRIQNFLTEKRGFPLELFDKVPSDQIRHLWSLALKSNELVSEMKKIKNLSGFGFQDFQKKNWFHYRLTLQEFGAETFRK